jgi:serine/threonine protein kinase/Flp pilus assembly protein TadD
MDPKSFASIKPAPGADESPADQLAAHLADEMADSWSRGHHCRAEELLAQHPELYHQPRAAVRLIYEEVCLRQAMGDDVSTQELRARFPDLRADLDVLLNCHHLLEFTSEEPLLPDVGDTLGEYRLLAQLGRGALGRVFLAEQSFLAERLVVLKVTPCSSREHLTLARLQHTHIVPLYAFRDFTERNLRVICMPCLGGATLQRVLLLLGDIPPAQRTGADLRRALAEAAADPRMNWPGRGSSWKFLEQASYLEAICWIGVCAAEALHHARKRGLVHLDLKPSNLLLTADGQPMLLDFHLARPPVPAGSLAPDWLGGTPAYMSPEQRAATLAVTTGDRVARAVDERSDVYSLGLLLAEALGGGPPGAAADSPPLAGRALEHLSTGLRDILTRSLRPDPEKRYHDAAALAEDLRRHLTDRPLLGVTNRNPVERLAKWRRRRPHAFVVVGLILVVATALSTVVGYELTASRRRLIEATAAFEAGKAHLGRREYAEAADALDHSASLFNNADTAIVSDIRRSQRQARRGQAARALHTQADRLRYVYGDDSLRREVLLGLESTCKETWAARDLLLDDKDAALDADEEEQLRIDLFDVAVLWVDFRKRLAAPGEQESLRRDAMEILLHAEGLFGRGAVLVREMRALGANVQDVVTEPRTAWEHYVVGRTLLRSADLGGASAEFEQAVTLRPHDFWPWFYRGLCACRRQRYEEAVTAYTVCIALRPESAACYHDRGIAEAALGQSMLARADYDKALQLNPGLAAAALNRGALSLRENRLTDAAADLATALSLGAEPAAVHFNLALVYQANRDRAAALASVDRALRYRPDYREARELRRRLAP